jgi:hypothetical protein
MGHDVRWEDDGLELQAMEVGPFTLTGAVARRPYMTCCHGHKWTIKEVTRIANSPDEILLGFYIGDD